MSLLLVELSLLAVTPPEQFLDPETERYWKTLLQARIHDDADRRESRDTQFDPRLGWRMKQAYSKPGVSHDSRGFRFTPGGTPAGLAVVIGDSFTYGLGVKDQDTYAARLADLTGVQVVNAGVNAYGVDQAMLLWELERPHLRPQLVVLGYFVDDFFRNGIGVRDGPKPRFVQHQPGAEFQLTGVPVPHPGTWSGMEALQPGWSLRTLDAFGWVRRRFAQWSGFTPDATHEQMAELNRYLLRRLAASVDADQAGLVVLIFGHCYDGAPRYLWAEQTIVDACDDLELTCINVAARMREQRPHEFFGDNCHFSAAGHLFTARLLAAEWQAQSSVAWER